MSAFVVHHTVHQIWLIGSPLLNVCGRRLIASYTIFRKGIISNLTIFMYNDGHENSRILGHKGKRSMRKTTNRMSLLLAITALCLAVGSLSACGKKADLYLPDEAELAKQEQQKKNAQKADEQQN